MAQTEVIKDITISDLIDMVEDKPTFYGPYSTFDVAKFIVFQGDVKSLEARKIIKLVYIANGWLLGLTKGRHKLVDEEAEVWWTGPMYRSLFLVLSHANKENGKHNIIGFRNELTDEYDIDPNSFEGILIQYICDNYGPNKTRQLSEVTNKIQSPWYYALTSGKMTIPDRLIADCYKYWLKNRMKKINKQGATND